MTRGQVIAVNPTGIPVPPVQAGIHLVPAYITKKQALSSSPQKVQTDGLEARVLGNVLGWAAGQPSAWIARNWGECTVPRTGTVVGEQRRDVECIDIATGAIRSADACHRHLKPPDSQYCFAKPLCSTASSQALHSCHGAAKCGSLGCECSDGLHGSLCQIPAVCGTSQSARLECCSTAALSSMTGECCVEGETMDAQGHCCRGDVDACGVCNGNAINVDIQGSCCEGTLDGQGLCCESNDLDECGICGGQNECLTVVRCHNWHCSSAPVIMGTCTFKAFACMSQCSDCVHAYHNGSYVLQVVMQGVLRDQQVTWDVQNACPQLAAGLNLPPASVTCRQLSNDEFAPLTTAYEVPDREVVLELAVPHSTEGTGLGSQVMTADRPPINMHVAIKAVSTDSFAWSFDAVRSDILQAAAQSLVDTEVGNAVMSAVVAIHRNPICGNNQCELGELVCTRLN